MNLQWRKYTAKLAGQGLQWRSIFTIYHTEMNRMWRTAGQSIASPVLSTSLYFIVFGSAIGSHIQKIDGIPYGAFIVPGLILMSVLTQSVANASFGIYFPRFSGTIYEVLSAPMSYIEILLGYVGAAASKSLLLSFLILITAGFFVPLEIKHPFWMLSFLILNSITFSLIGFIIGLWVDGFDKLQMAPLLIMTPLSFLGGSFYSIKMLPPFWYKISMLNPVVYIISGLRWSFYGVSDISPYKGLLIILIVLFSCCIAVRWIFKTGKRLKQ